MKNKIIPISLILFFITGCGPDSPLGLLLNPPECTITSQSDLFFEENKIPYMKVTVKNTSGGPVATDIKCFIRLKKGSHISDESGVYFGYLDNNESKTEEIWFLKIKDRSEYTYKEIYLSWYDAEGTYYEKQY